LYIYFYLLSLLVCALVELSSRFKGYVVDTTPGAATLEVVVVAPSRNPSNKLDITRSSRSNQLGKNASVFARLPCLWQGNRNYPECNDSGRSRNRSSYERVQQVRYKRIEQTELVGKGREHHRMAAVLMARNRSYPKCNDSGCSRNRSSHERVQQVRCKPIERIELVGKEREHRRVTAVLMVRKSKLPRVQRLWV
jgi:hypothetical protein